MQPILLDRFRDVLLRRGKSAAGAPETLLDAHGQDEIFYIPFEHVNRAARIVIVGITPGPNQVDAAYEAAKRLLAAGAPDEIVLSEVKREGSFGSATMRPNLVRMLDEMGFPELLGLASCDALWGQSFGLLQATSVVPHAAFRRGKPFAGSFDDVLRSPALRRGFEEHFVPSLGSLPRSAMYVALGPTPLNALDWCAARGHIDPGQIMGALAHPSSQSGSQVAVYLGQKGPADLTPGDPVLRRISDLQSWADRMRAAVAQARGVASLIERQPVSPPEPVPSMPMQARETARPIPSASETRADFVDPALRSAFERAGYRCLKDTVKKVALFDGGRSGREVYVVNGRPGITVVVHPSMNARAHAAVTEPQSVVRSAPFNHDNLRTFPAHDNGGEKTVRFGYAVDCRTIGALEDFLTAFDRA